MARSSRFVTPILGHWSDKLDKTLEIAPDGSITCNIFSVISLSLLVLSNLLRLSSVHDKAAASVNIQISRQNRISDLQWSGAVDVPVHYILSDLGEKELYPLYAPTQLLGPKS